MQIVATVKLNARAFLYLVYVDISVESLVMKEINREGQVFVSLISLTYRESRKYQQTFLAKASAWKYSVFLTFHPFFIF